MPLDSARLLAFLLNAALEAAVIAAGAAVALRLMRTAKARVKHRIAVAGLALSAAIPMMSAWPATSVAQMTPATTPVIDTRALADDRLATLLVGGYVALLLWRIATLTRAAAMTTRLRRSSTPIAEGPILESLRRFTPPRRSIRAAHSPRATSPLVTGVARPLIVFPDSHGAADRDLIDAVMAHECAHVVRHDVAITIAIEVLTAPFVAHPAVAALKRTAAKYREIACDELAAARLRVRRRTYASLLLRMAEWRTNGVVGIASGAAGHLEARVRDLLAPRRSRRVGAARQAFVCLWLAVATAAAPLCAIAIDSGWTEVSGAWTLDVDESQPQGRLMYRAAWLRIDAAGRQLHIAQQRTRHNGVDETFEIQGTIDDVPFDVTLPDGTVVRTRARWEGPRLVTDASPIGGEWREYAEAVATRNRLVITAENVTTEGRRHSRFVFRRE